MRQVDDSLEAYPYLNETALADEVEHIAKLGRWRLDLSTGELTWSREMYELFGVDPEAGDLDLAAVTESAIHPEDRAIMREVNAAVLSDGIPRPMEYRILLPDWSVRWVEARGRQELGHDGKVVALVGFVHDITDRKLLELDLIEREERLKAVVENAPFAAHVYQLMPGDRLVLIGYNRRAEEGLGRSHADLVGLSIDDAFPEAVEDELRRQYCTVARDGVGWETDDYVFEGHGGSATLQIFAFPIGARRVCVFFRDVTEKRRLERALRESESRLGQVVHAAPFPIMLHAEDGQVVRINQAWQQATGYGHEEIPTVQDWVERAHPEDTERVLRDIRVLYSNPGKTEHGERSIRTASGETRVFDLFSAEMGKLPDGRTLVMSSARDITESRHQQRKLERISRAFKTLGLCSQTLVRTSSEEELLARVCDIVVEVCGYSMAWIVFARPDDPATIVPVQCAGGASNYLDSIALDWADDCDAQSACGRSLTTGMPTVIRNGGLAAGISTASAAEMREPRVTAGLPLRDRGGEPFGSLVVVSLDAGAFDAEELRLLTELAEDLAYGICSIRTSRLREDAEFRSAEANARLERAMLGLTETIGRIIEASDPTTSGHQRRVAMLARAIATEMGLSQNVINAVEVASLVHDVGKLRVPSEILTRQRALSPLEMSIVTEHSRAGHEVLREVDFGSPIAEYVLQHHERLDGSGYPQGLVGDEISLEARILAVADVVEAMSSHRPYRPSWGMEAAVAEVVGHPELFDASVAAACERLFRSGQLVL